MRIDFETTFADSIHWELQIIVRFAEPEAEAGLQANDLRYTDRVSLIVCVGGGGLVEFGPPQSAPT